MLADALSRAPAYFTDRLPCAAVDDTESHVNMVTTALPASDVMLQ